jgi:hypothetical protein
MFEAEKWFQDIVPTLLAYVGDVGVVARSRGHVVFRSLGRNTGDKIASATGF